ncbi:hypothetical protein KCU61_g417, partial [Aureobasidium melanogenum]
LFPITVISKIQDLDLQYDTLRPRRESETWNPPVHVIFSFSNLSAGTAAISPRTPRRPTVPKRQRQEMGGAQSLVLPISPLIAVRDGTYMPISFSYAFWYSMKDYRLTRSPPNGIQLITSCRPA